jgi:hypothetical protein
MQCELAVKIPQEQSPEQPETAVSPDWHALPSKKQHARSLLPPQARASPARTMPQQNSNAVPNRRCRRMRRARGVRDLSSPVLPGDRRNHTAGARPLALRNPVIKCPQGNEVTATDADAST